MKTLPSGRKDGICDCRGGEAYGSFAKTVRIVVAFDEPGFELWSFRKSKDVIGVEVPLLDRAVLDCDGFLEDGTQRKECSTFQLRAGAIWIDDLTAIDHGDEAIDVDDILLDGDFSHLSEICVDRGTRDATAAARRKGFAPFTLLCGEIENRDQPLGFERPLIGYWLFLRNQRKLEEMSAEQVWILLCRVRQLVNERLDRAHVRLSMSFLSSRMPAWSQ